MFLKIVNVAFPPSKSYKLSKMLLVSEQTQLSIAGIVFKCGTDIL